MDSSYKYVHPLRSNSTNLGFGMGFFVFDEAHWSAAVPLMRAPEDLCWGIDDDDDE